MRIVLCGSPPFATPVFERLLGSRHRPLALVTAPDRPQGRGRTVEPSELVRAARAAQVEVLQPADPHAEEHLAQLSRLRPDVLLVASYVVILKAREIDLAPQGALNVHASLLPRWRGASPIQAAILAGDAVTGVSIQRIVKALDEGDVLLSKERAIGSDETAGDLLRALAQLGGEAALEALDLIESGRAHFTPQDSTQATYARKLTKEQGTLDWSKSADELARFVRAMNPWPGASTSDAKGRGLTVLVARALDRRVAAEPGVVLETQDRFVVACGRGALDVVNLVPAGKRAMGGADFVRGARTAVGERLGAENSV